MKMKSFARSLLFVLWLALTLVIVPAQAMPVAGQSPTPDGLTAADWSAIQAFLPSDYLKASNTGAFDYFGYAVAVSGDTVVVGAVGEASAATGVNGNQADNSASVSGAAYVFTRAGGVWSQQAYLKASNTGAGDRFGFAVAVSGDTIVVGAPYEDSNATGVNGDQADNSASNAGAAYVFTRTGGVWSQQAYLKASNTGASDQFGSAVAVSGDAVVVGAPLEASAATGVNGNQADNSASWSGAAYLFTRTGGVWSQQAYLKASNTDAWDYFGLTVAVSGDTVVVGATFEDSAATEVNGDQADNSAPDSGAAYVFTRAGGVWSQQAYLKASNTDAGDRFGVAVAVSGNTVVVGGAVEASAATGVNGDQADNSAPDSGAAYVFTRADGVWSQQAYLKASNTDAGDIFGHAVAVSGDTVVVGAWEEASNATGVDGDQANNSATSSGAAYVFTRTGGVWSQQAYLKASNTGISDRFGSAVAVSGDTVVVVAHLEDSAATGVNGDEASNSASDSGAAYFFGNCRRSAQTGAWEDTATWVGAVAPTSADGVCIESGHTVILNGDDAIDQLWVYQGGTLDLGTHTLTVERSVSNEGTLRQSRMVDGSGPVNFLQIRNIADSIDQYRGVDIAAGLDLGQTVVEVQGNAAVCTNSDGRAYRNRCFMVNPTNAGTVDITLHTTPSEDDVSDDAFFQYLSDTWVEGAACADGVGVGGACTGSAMFAGPAWFLVGSNVVLPPNAAPVAVDDTAVTNANTPVNINVLDNDSDPDDDPLSISAVGAAINGTAVISNTQVTYTPATDFTGTDVFTYTISDGDLADSATVTVTVNATASITIIKDATPADGTDFHFTANSTGPAPYLTKWGSFGEGNAPFSDFGGIAINSAGEIYVSDASQYVRQFDTDFVEILLQLGGSGSGDGQMDSPTGIAFDSAGNIVVLDALNARIQKFAPDGTYLTQWGSWGSGNGEFIEPYGLAIDANDNIYVADTFNHRIQKFDATGAYLTQWGSQGGGNGEFTNPYGVAIDSAGNVYVTDTSADRIQKFDADGNYLTQWGGFGSGDGQMENPTGIAIDGNGNVYVADSSNYRIQKFTSDGTYLTQWDGAAGYLAFDNAGDLYAIGVVNVPLIQKFTNDGTLLDEWDSYGTGNGLFSFPAGIDVDGDGNVYVADYNNSRIQKFTNDGTYLRKWGNWSYYSATNSSFYQDVAVDSVGNVYAVDYVQERVQKFTSDGTFLTEWGSSGSGDGQFVNPSGIAVDSNNDVYVVDRGNNRIQKFDSNGAYLLQWGSIGTGNGQFATPSGIAVDASGNVYVSDADGTLSGRIQKFTSDGTYLTHWDADATNLDVDASGNVYATDGSFYLVRKFTGDGVYLGEWGSFGSGDGQFNYPLGVAVDNSGNIFVGDTFNNRIQKFGPLAQYEFILDDADIDDGDAYTTTITLAGLSPGTYAVNETVLTGWTLTNLSCDSGTWNQNGNGVLIDLAAGENVTCTFENAFTANSAPVAEDDTAVTLINTPVTIDVLANDSDPEDDPLSISAVGSASNGTAVINNDQITYTPATDFTGTDSFTYTISDGDLTDSATVTVTVNESGGSCVNIEQPLRTSFYTDANPIYASAGQSFTVPTGANETFGITAHFGFIEADSTITLNLYNGPASGNIGTPIATATYTNAGPRMDAPIGSDLAIYFEFANPVSLTPGNEYYYLLSPSFDPVAFSYAFASGNPYTEGSALSGLSDGTVGSWSYDLKFTIHLCEETANTAPVAEDDTAVTLINTPVTIDVLANDSDPEDDPLSISAVGSASNGTAVINNDQITYTPATDFTGTDSFTYTISDGDLTDTATVTVTVNEDSSIACEIVEFVDINAALTPVGFGSVAWGDYDGDGYLDVALTGGDSTAVFRNNGDGTFTDINANMLALKWGSIDWGDYDNDGDLDLLVTGTTGAPNGNTPGTTKLYRNDNGTFVDTNAALPGLWRGEAVWGDYDNDDNLDILMVGQGVGARIYRNNGDGTFTDIAAGLPGFNYASADWGDYDNDGNLDFILTGDSGGATSAIYRNNGDGTFTNINAGLTGVVRGDTDWGDYDGDGDLDLVLTGETQVFGVAQIAQIYRNDGGTFTNINAGLIGVHNSGVEWGDYDNDGDLDLVLSGASGVITRWAGVYRNDGGGTFANINAGLLAQNYAHVTWGDYDNDGDLDILMTGFNAGVHTKIYRNDCATPVTVEVTPGTPATLNMGQGNNRGVEVNIGAGSLPAGSPPTTMSLTPTDAPTAAPGNFQFGGVSFSLNAFQNGEQQDGFTFNPNDPPQITITYSDDDVAGLGENGLVLRYYNEGTGTWETDGITVISRDPAANTVTFAITHLTDFALFGQVEYKAYLPLITRP